ncbi:transposase [Paenarthrobacter sp. Z7-10]|uniref:transposase n=1 Tax=Paenarthrobacter sp. Z7-10 TaxID=2787635 RepID=UPI0022A9432D|nr:transposase [Paenarthrobacter sp. Z7-10]MCZ2405110.1 transposase [Paenarthrobacter sp. Z7-10]
MSARQTFSDEFKADAVDLVISSGRPIATVASELGVSVTALRRWIRYHNEGHPDASMKPDQPVEAAKYKALETRLREVERENEFLKKVSAFFAKEQR